MSDQSKTEEFRALAAQVAPLDKEASAIKMKMVKLSHAMTLEIMREAFPEAKIVGIKAVSEIKPTDLAKSAQEAVRLLNEAGITPDTIIVDMNRFTVVLGIAHGIKE